MKIRLTSFDPRTNTVHVFDHKDLTDYTAWVERGYANGYRSRRVTGDNARDDLVMFLPTANPEANPVFTAEVVDD